MIFNIRKKDWRVKEREKEIRNNQRFERLMAIEKRKAKEREKKHKIRQIHQKNRYLSERKSKFTTSKLLMFLILINCTIVEVYSMWVMYTLQDLSALYTLITAVIGESVAYAIYSAKSFNETKEEAKITLEREKFLCEHGLNQNTDNDEPVMEENEEIEIVG